VVSNLETLFQKAHAESLLLGCFGIRGGDPSQFTVPMRDKIEVRAPMRSPALVHAARNASYNFPYAVTYCQISRSGGRAGSARTIGGSVARIDRRCRRGLPESPRSSLRKRRLATNPTGRFAAISENLAE